MDARLFRWFNHVADRTAWAHGVARFFATYGIVAFAVLLLLAWWDARSAEDSLGAVTSVIWAGVASLIGVGLVQIIGGAIDRARPTTVLHGTHLLLDRTSDFAFPSDHTTACSAVAAGLVLAAPLLRHHWYGWAAAGLTLLMAVTRVYVGAHYPGDVLGGMLLGSIVAVGLAVSGRWLVGKALHVVAGTPLRPLIAQSDASAS